MYSTGDGRQGSTEDFGGLSMCDCVRVSVALALLMETASHRHRIHRARWDTGRPCDAKVVIAGVNLTEGKRRRVPAASGEHGDTCPHCGRSDAPAVTGTSSVGQRFLLSGECPCRPLLVEVFVSAHLYLKARGNTLRRPEAAARRHVASRQHDFTRQRRGDMGAQVRTDRLLASRRARQLETDEQRLLLRDIAEEAGSEAPLEDDAQLERRLATLRGRRCGIDPESLLADVRRDLILVRRHYSSGPSVNVGTRAHPELVSWWDAYIEGPLGRRPRSSDLAATTGAGWVDGEPPAGLDLPCAATEASFQRVLDQRAEPYPSKPAGARNPVVDALRRSARADPLGDRSRQFELILRDLASAGSVLSETVETFLADPTRRLAAVDALDEVLATSS